MHLRQPHQTHQPAPPAAVATTFMEDMFGAIEVAEPHPGGNGSCAWVKWVELPGATSQYGGGLYNIHFVESFQKRGGAAGSANMTIYDFADYVDNLRGGAAMAAGEWDQYMDYHIGFAVDDLAPFVANFQAAEVPFFAREAVGSDVAALGSLFSIFVQVPGANSMLIELSSAVPPSDSVDVQPWALCSAADEGAAVGAVHEEVRVHEVLRKRREHRERGAAVALGASAAVGGGKGEAEGEGEPLPVMWPLHTTYASSDPAADALYMQEIFAAVPITQQIPDANGTCAQQSWVELPGSGGASGMGGMGYDYQIRFGK